jgi:hypothetical protein
MMMQTYLGSAFRSLPFDVNQLSFGDKMILHGARSAKKK